MHKNNNIENMRNLSLSTFGECDGLQVNSEFVAWLAAGPGGQIVVHPVSDKFRSLHRFGVSLFSKCYHFVSIQATAMKYTSFWSPYLEL